jgi:hypothetical protein
MKIKKPRMKKIWNEKAQNEKTWNDNYPLRLISSAIKETTEVVKNSAFKERLPFPSLRLCEKPYTKTERSAIIILAEVLPTTNY